MRQLLGLLVLPLLTATAAGATLIVDHLSIIRKLAFDETHDQGDITLARQAAIALEADLHLVGVILINEALELS